MSVYDITDLTQKLAGGTSNGYSLLQDWDIMVAYDETALNNLLALQGAAAQALETVPEFQVEVPSGSDVYDYTLTLSNPTLQFLQQGNTQDSALIQISFTLSGSISLNGVGGTVPDGITMIVTTELVYANGYMNNGTFRVTHQRLRELARLRLFQPAPKHGLDLLATGFTEGR
ncbi:hypothetical protein ABW21_db0203590 [Orbilia brochopaga]|nr:hypothetical protein ABW21_db0203590 [Drechslerella brochopaga]